MSLTRRLRRLLRAHLGSLRADDPLDDPLDPSIGAGSTTEAEGADTTATDPSSPRGAAEVPPDVAKAYRALEVPVGSDRETVKKGYRRMMKKYHQDRFRDDEEKHEIAGTVSKRLNQAYERVIEYLDNSS